MRPVGLALDAREVLARPLGEVIPIVTRAVGLGFVLVWLLAETVEELIAFPLGAAALGTAVPTVRVGARLLPYDTAATMAEDLAVLDNILAGRLDVAVLVEDRAGGGVWGQLMRARSLRDVANGQSIDLGASGLFAAVRVSPPRGSAPASGRVDRRLEPGSGDRSAGRWSPCRRTGTIWRPTCPKAGLA